MTEAVAETPGTVEAVWACTRCHMPMTEPAILSTKSWPEIVVQLWLHGLVCRVFHRDLKFNAWVLNHTNKWLSIGFTTSPTTNGHFIGWLITDKAAKRQEQEDGKAHKEFRGLFAHAGFWWAKVYIYLYFDGDGRK